MSKSPNLTIFQVMPESSQQIQTSQEPLFDSKEFVEIKVQVGILNKDDFKKSIGRLIDITLGDFKIDQLPYREEIANNDMGKKMGELRESKVRVVLRAEQRSYQEIKANGGIHPHPTQHGVYPNKANEILDVRRHRMNSEKTGYVSTTTCLSQVKFYSPKFIYFIKAVGALPPTASQSNQDDEEDIFGESEYSLPGGLGIDLLLGGRQVLDGKEIEIDNGKKFVTFNGSSIFLRRQFIHSYPKAALKLVETILEPHETCILPQEMNEELIKFNIIPSGNSVKMTADEKIPRLEQHDSKVAVPTYDMRRIEENILTKQKSIRKDLSCKISLFQEEKNRDIQSLSDPIRSPTPTLKTQ